MTVWVVQFEPYHDNHEFIGVFSTSNRAWDAASQYAERNKSPCYRWETQVGNGRITQVWDDGDEDYQMVTVSPCVVDEVSL